MKFGHIGIACRDILNCIEFLKSIVEIDSISEQIYDKNQDAVVCMIKTKDGLNIELISGNKVKNIVNKGITYYHLCYKVDDINKYIDYFVEKNCVILSKPQEAVLFDNNKVAFIYTPLGLIELLEEK